MTDLSQKLAELRAKAEKRLGPWEAMEINPATVLALLAVMEAAQKRVGYGHGSECAAVQSWHRPHREPCDCGHDELDRALSNLARNP